MITCIVLYSILVNGYAEATLSESKTDARVKVVSFQPNQIYRLKTHYLISTDIIFSHLETVQDYHLGDASAWDIETSGNHLYVKSKKVDATGNLNVTTNKFTYHFLLGVSIGKREDADQVLVLQFNYSRKLLKDDSKLALASIRVPRNICKDKQQYNLQYSFTGDHEQSPIQACDDGLFTYFKFRKQIELPAIFVVQPDRSEKIVNYRMESGYMVVEQIAKAFTLRNGETITSVYNDKYISDWNKNRRLSHE